MNINVIFNYLKNNTISSEIRDIRLSTGTKLGPCISCESRGVTYYIKKNLSIYKIGEEDFILCKKNKKLESVVKYLKLIGDSNEKNLF